MQSNPASDIDAELRKRWFEPRCPKMKGRYAEWRECEHREDTRITALMVGLLYILFSVTDVILIPDVSIYSIWIRLVIGGLFVIGIHWEIKQGVRLSLIEIQCATVVFIAYSAWLCISSFSDYQENVTYYLTYGAVFMMVQNIFFNLSFRVVFVSSTIITVSFVVALIWNFHASMEYAVAVGTLYSATYLLTLIVNWKLNEERYRVFLNSAHADQRHQEAMEHGAALLRLSATDSLTGLANRRAIDDELRALWDRWQSEAKCFAVVLIDIDHFKRFNDCYGHQAGDRCLVSVAGAMERAIEGGGCMLGRFGGEEFILLVHARSRDHMASMMEAVRRAVENLRIPHEQRPDDPRVVTVSVGGAFSQDVTGAKVERLVTEADRALYQAKRGKRNCIRVFDANDPERVDFESSIADLLGSAIEQKYVTLEYQPLRDAASGAIIAAEALMRLRTPAGAPISPATFIPIAERTGAIVELGKWAIRTALRDVVSAGSAPLVSVNVSAVQLKSPGFVLAIAAIVAESRVPPGSLAIEITEGLRIEGQADIVSVIDELRVLGVRIWLDDFGTGFAGLSCIREIDFDTIKIDRSFLHASGTPKGAEMFGNIIDLVKDTGSRTLVEGVQTEEQRLLAVSQGVDVLQGYLLGRPMPAQRLVRLARSEAGTKSEIIAA